MKKLSLKNLKLDANDLLQREQLKTVFGGYGGYGSAADCTADCGKDSCERSVSVTCSGSNCASIDDEGCSSNLETKTCKKAVDDSNNGCPPVV